MQNFDVENNFLLVNKALLLVLKMCFGFATTGLCYNRAKRGPLQRFVQHLDQTLEKFANALRNIFVKHFKRFYKGMNDITNTFQCICKTAPAVS